MKLKLLITAYFCIVNLGFSQNSALKSIYQEKEPPISIEVSEDKLYLITSSINNQSNLSIFSKNGNLLSSDNLEIPANQTLISFVVVNGNAAALYFNSVTNLYTLFTKRSQLQDKVTKIINLTFPDGFKPENVFFDGKEIFSIGLYLGRIFVTRLDKSSFIFSKLLINDQNTFVKAIRKNGELFFIINSYINDELRIFSSSYLDDPVKTIKINNDTQLENLLFSQNLNFAVELFLNTVKVYSASETFSYNLSGDYLLTGIYEVNGSVSVVVDKYRNLYKTKAVYEKVKRNNKYEYTTIEKEVFDEREFIEKKIINFDREKEVELNVATGFTVSNMSVPTNKFTLDGGVVNISSFYTSSGINIGYDFYNSQLISKDKINHDGLKKYNGLKAYPTNSGWFVMGTQYLYEQNNQRVYNISFYSD
ncbi:hypothetical protein OO013_13560 [Mangrovivirga sp. M17]|uniref:Uncharacterized protein n=1 Tax=Mangrovivirga halotolerans TaxID=2993936 RepID=A0ABT3RSZ5_9BACT|nr:hypothetical protein [Mangrovivirga halotolerans]MCX2744904.1 hypothetical protein [Mangrovivirga halotolerans]